MRQFASFTAEMQLITELINNGKANLLFKTTVKNVIVKNYIPVMYTTFNDEKHFSIKEKSHNNATFPTYYT